MSKTKIITDCTCGLSAKELKERGVDYLDLTFTVEGKDYRGFDNPFDDPQKFYENLKKTKKCSTSCANTQEFLDIFSKWTNEGYDVVYVGLSGGLSATYQNACNAASQLNETGEQKIYCANSLTGNLSESLLIDYALDMAKKGVPAKEIYEAIHNDKLGAVAIFTPGDLQFLTRCGRIGKFVAGIGTMLSIVPIMSSNEEGKLYVISKCLGRKKANNAMLQMVKDKIDGSVEQTIYIGHTGIPEEAEKLKQMLMQSLKNINVEIRYIDYVMGCCCGPDTLAVFFLQKV